MAKRTQADLERRFWDRYINLLHNHGVKPPYDRWYLIRAEAFIRAFPDRRLVELGPEEIEAYLTSVGQRGLEAWQFRQVVDAIRNLYSIINTEWAHVFDWKFWLDSARVVDAQHATVAREHVPATPKDFAERIGDTRHTALIQAHLPLFSRFSAVMRGRGMSIRTEKAYMAWACRFIRHLDGRPPVEAGAAEVSQFLENLAVRRNVSASTQNPALNALVFLYDQVLQQPLGDLGAFRGQNDPNVFLQCSPLEKSGVC